MRYKSLKVLLVSLLFFSSVSPAQKLPFSYYTPESENNPLPSAAIYKIIQDTNGYIWIAIYSEGVVRYDGNSFQVFSKKNGLITKTIMNLQVGPRGRLWVLSDQGIVVTGKPLSHYKINEPIKFVNSILGTPLLATSISQVAFNAFLIDAKGNIWVGTTGLGIVRYQYTASSFLKADTFSTIVNDENTNETVYALGGGNNQNIWAGVAGALLRFDPQQNQFIKIPISENPPTSNVHAMLELPDGNIWGGTENGLIWNYRPSEGIFHFFKKRISGHINKILYTHDGKLLFATDSRGVLTITKPYTQSNTWITEDNGLLKNNLYDIYEDREDNIWFSHIGGISKLRYNYKAFQHVTSFTSSSSNQIIRTFGTTSIIPPISENVQFPLWITAKTGLIYLKNFKEGELLDTKNGLKNNETYDAIRDKKGRIWIGNYTGIQCISDKNNLPQYGLKKDVRPISIDGQNKYLSYFDVGIIGVCNKILLPISEGSKITQETLWFNGYRSMVAYIDNEWYVFSQKAGLPASIMYTVTLDKKNKLWVGTGNKGLYATPRLNIRLLKSLSKSKPGGLVQEPLFTSIWNRENGAPTNEFIDIIAVDDRLICGLPTGIISASLDSVNNFHRIDFSNETQSSTITSMHLSLNKKNIWVGTNKELYEFSLDSEKIIRHLTRSDGLLSGETNWLEGIKVGQNGLVYMANPNGISIYNPSMDSAKYISSQISMQKFYFKNSLWGNNELKATYTLLSFSNENRNRYKTFLEGFDDKWSDITESNKIRYTGLSAYFWPKEYTLEVMAANSDNLWTNIPLSMKIRVDPPLFFRWWAFCLYFLLMFSTGLGVRWMTVHWREFFIPRRRYISHYKLLNFLGKGGMGEVFRARDIHNDKIVAIKILSQELMNNPENRRRLLSEAHLILSLNNPHIVKAIEIGEIRDSPFLVMEYLTGGTLKEYIQQMYPLSQEEIIRIALQICQGLQGIHEKNIIHRDIKTGNILLDAEGNIRIMDFGISRSPLVTTMTTLGTIIGTLGYVAPEQITNQNIDHRTDLFSLGVVLYELATNTAPFTGDNEIALIHSIFNTVPPGPSTLNPVIAKGYTKIIMKCLEKNPDMRFTSAKKVSIALFGLQENYISDKSND